MKYSALLFRTSKTISPDLAKNAKLLTQAGYIHQELAGVYTFLPLGLRVLNKIEAIVREEMDKVAQEILMTSLAPQKNWQQTGRLETVDVLMKTTGANPASLAKNSNEYVLSSTHEEIVTPLVQGYLNSYKELPVGVYQIQTKFRNEPRAKSGLLRCREFRMKDAYSFHRSAEDLQKYYEQMKDVYMKIFERVGLGKDTVLTLASGGDFTPDFSHEFQTICDAGEDTIFQVPSTGLTFNREVAPSQAEPMNNENEELKAKEDVLGKGIIGVEELAAFLKIPVDKTTKTLILETDDGKVVAAAVRGTYQINLEKLAKIIGCKKLAMASAETVERVTGAKVGYAGVLNLPKEVAIYFDESCKGRRNFECGANKTDYHSINVNFGRDIPEPEKFYDIKLAREGDRYPETGEVYTVNKACEVGNIFPLNTKFSKAFGFEYMDENSKPQPIYMGCYGIGPSRVMGVLVEKFADEKGLVWPKQVAPYQVHLIDINAGEAGQKLYDTLTTAGIEVLWDDRDTRPGEKFADAELLGIPNRVVISAKTGDKVEWKERSDDKTELISVEDLIKKVK